MEFHVTNTFLQTLLLVVVGYMSFFFDIDNFTDRIMVSLTTMLVIATIVTANQAVSVILDDIISSILEKTQISSVFVIFVTSVYHLILGFTKNILLQSYRLLVLLHINSYDSYHAFPYNYSVYNTQSAREIKKGFS